jgi:beta-lactamase regulating signal transducer with metallopeptidase domain
MNRRYIKKDVAMITTTILISLVALVVCITLLFKGLYQTQRNDSTYRMAPNDRYLNNAMDKYKKSRIHLRKQVNYT